MRPPRFAAAVGEAAEHAMSTAVAVAAMQRKGDLVRELANASEEKSDSGSDSDDDDEEQKARKAAQQAAQQAAREAAAAAEEQGEGESRPAFKRRLENVRWVKKLHAEVRNAQG